MICELNKKKTPLNHLSKYTEKWIDTVTACSKCFHTKFNQNEGSSKQYKGSDVLIS